ncbi:STAS domain-containing protein [Streptomyces sp. NPDC127079]|uniref:STAS domain-containing protein n=1 Tax=Streptomyces sp. NPDC127079 TaxID=3347132 RepID=UPI00366433E1
MQSFFDVRITDSPGRIVLTLAGELDFTARSQAAPLIGPLVLADRDLVVDLTRVTFMDAAGLGMLLRLCERVAAGGGAMELRGLRPEVRRVLELTGTDGRFAEETGPAHGAPGPALGAA